MKGNDKIAEYGKDTRFPINDPTKGGRKPSIKKQLLQLLSAEGHLKIEAANVISVADDGSVVIKVPTEMQVGMKLMQWAMSRRGNDSMKAIQMIMEQIDGKPKNTHEITGEMTVQWNEVKTYEAND